MGQRKRQRRENLRTRQAAEAARLYKGNPIRQVHFILGAEVPAEIGRVRSVGYKRYSDLFTIMCRIIKNLAAIGVRVQDVRYISRKNAIALVKYWSERREPLTKGTIDQYVNVLRCFMAMIGRADVIPKHEEWRKCLENAGVAVARERREQIPEHSKGWSDKSVDVYALLPAIREHSPVSASILRLAREFGFRPSEGYQLKPERSDRKDHVYLWDTKGGKPRPVYYSSDPEKAARQREAFEEALAVVQAVNPQKGILAEPGRTVKQMKRRFYYVMEKFGVTKAKLGVVPHGLRHDYANEEFEHLSGLPAPAKKTLPAAVYRENKELVLAARRAVSAQMGHERASIVKCYTGSEQKLLIAEARNSGRMAKLLTRVEAFAPTFLQAGFMEMWILDVEALATSRDRRPSFAVAFTRDEAVASADNDGRVLARLSGELGTALGCSVSFLSWASRNRPDDALEVNLEQTRHALAASNGR